MAQKTIQDLFHDTLQVVYYSEKKIVGSLPEMAEAAQSEELKAAFDKHLEETEGQILRLEQIFGIIDEQPQGKRCLAIDGIMDEGTEIMKEYAASDPLDAALIGAAQAVEHYEIARYGTLQTLAEGLGLTDAAELLAATLQEEEQADVHLTALAQSFVNETAQMAAE